MNLITEWMVAHKIAENGFAARHIKEGLKLEGLRRDEQESRCRLYRKWRPKTDKKNELLSVEAYDLAIAGIDPDDVEPRQIELFEALVNAE
jgi:hypothetical protein